MRNQLIFENRSYSEEETILTSIREAREWHQTQSQITRPIKTATARSIPRLPDVSKGFVDAAWNAGIEECRIGWFFTDAKQESLIQGTSYRRHVGSALCAEALTLKGALEKATATGIQELNMFSDSQILISLINSDTSTIDLKGILHDISLLSSTFEAITFTFISRANNTKVDTLAKTKLLSCCNSSCDGA
ncbi:unnamed protein product [Arabis nemorensis]|uniref:RNase H type-1 domain-containing protein n=1 Tax=Arabis nemorensis TaxID=586526 RepID=A0A565CCI0_9BRAS|nr:unnamed protein product [Arabis nemorensis]